MADRKRGFSVLRSDEGAGAGSAGDERAARDKRRAAERALSFVKSGMKVGLGSGSTALLFVDLLGAAMAAGRLSGVRGVPTSEATEEKARARGIPLLPWQQNDALDVCVDGADEVTPTLDLLKGRGGALLREKAVAKRAALFVVVVDEGKLVAKLGARCALPIAVSPSHWQAEAKFVQGFGGQPALRETDGHPYVTDDGNYVVDARFVDGLADPEGMARRLELRPAVRAHGLFLGMAHVVVVAGAEDVRVLTR
jgi:ribose 5-phosphate isomerase A